MRRVLISLPIVFFCLFIVIYNFDSGLVIISEGNEPWYSPYTSVVFLVCSMFFYPITLLSTVLRVKVLGMITFALYFLYSVVISAVLYKYWPRANFT